MNCLPDMDLSNRRSVGKLIKACINGERKSQQILYQSFYGKMLGICARYANDINEAKDILQDGFIKVFIKLDTFENKGSLEGWVRRIVINNAIDHVRKKKGFLINFDDEETIFENAKNGYYDEFEPEKHSDLNAERIIKLVQKLTPAYRIVFNMFVIENYSHKEIAEKLNISVGSSKSNLAKAKLKLKELIKKYINDYEK